MRQLKLIDYLSKGKENAISSKELAKRLNLKSVRELQQIIHEERVAGAVILSTCERPGGYYLPNSESETREFIQTLESRAKHTFMAVQSAKKYIGGDV